MSALTGPVQEDRWRHATVYRFSNYEISCRCCSLASWPLATPAVMPCNIREPKTVQPHLPPLPRYSQRLDDPEDLHRDLEPRRSLPLGFLRRLAHPCFLRGIQTRSR